MGEGKLSDSGDGDNNCDGRITPSHVHIHPRTHWHVCMDTHSLTGEAGVMLESDTISPKIKGV